MNNRSLIIQLEKPVNNVGNFFKSSTSHAKIYKTHAYTLLTLLFLLVSLEACAATWIKVLDAEDEIYFVDSSTILRIKERSKASILINYKIVQRIEGVDAWSSRVDTEFDCANAKMLFHKAAIFELTMGKGSWTKIDMDNKWRDAKRAPLDSLMNAACRPA